MQPALDALDRLRQGNAKFVANQRSSASDAEQRQKWSQKQEPWAIVLGCADSRVTPEFVFDQKVGDLFVVRVAGNIATPTQVGSIEFAASAFGSRLIVVLGHSSCGAVSAAVDEVVDRTDSGASNIRSLIDPIRPSVKRVLAEGETSDRNELIAKCVRANVHDVAEQLRHDSQILADLIRDDGLLVVGGVYDLETGEVEFFDGMPG